MLSPPSIGTKHPHIMPELSEHKNLIKGIISLVNPIFFLGSLSFIKFLYALLFLILSLSIALSLVIKPPGAMPVITIFFSS